MSHRRTRENERRVEAALKQLAHDLAQPDADGDTSWTDDLPDLGDADFDEDDRESTLVLPVQRRPRSRTRG